MRWLENRAPGCLSVCEKVRVCESTDEVVRDERGGEVDTHTCARTCEAANEVAAVKGDQAGLCQRGAVGLR